MKRTIILSALALFALIGTASAQNNNAKTTENQPRKSCYVDADNNGKCDKFENGTGRGQGLRDGSGRRAADSQAMGQGRGKGQRRNSCGNPGNRRNFVDSDNNGVCDYRETRQQAANK